jgi:AcrR family transcriptional regulator
MRRVITKEEKREAVVKGAMALFAKNGIKDVTMDDIAHALKMSKRTLYELFVDKENLLLYCVKTEGLWQRDRLREYVQNAVNVLEPVLYDLHFKMQALSLVTPSFFTDLLKYPKVVAYVTEVRRGQRKLAVDYLSQGVQQGLFRSDVNFDIVYSVIVAQFDIMFSSKDFSKYTPFELFNNLVLNYFRGCATPEGVRIMDEFFMRHSEKL